MGCESSADPAPMGVRPTIIPAVNNLSTIQKNTLKNFIENDNLNMFQNFMGSSGK